MGWQDALGWLGSVLYLARLVPQPFRLWRTGQPHGVSVQAALNAVTSGVAWLLYGLAAGLLPVWVVMLPAIPLDLSMTWLLRRSIGPKQLLWTAGWAAVLAGSWVIGGAGLLGTMLGASVVINHAPSVWAAIRGGELHGIAPATWWLSLADAALWGGYGLIERDPALIAYGLILFTAGVTVLVRLAHFGRRARFALDDLPPPVESL